MVLIEATAIIGLIAIIIGTSLVSGSFEVRRRYTYPLLIFGGICLAVYSIYLKDMIFTILQIVFVISSIIGLIKINEKHLKKTKAK